jgi:hypothetical protein
MEKVYALGIVGAGLLYQLKTYFNGGVNKNFPSLENKIIVVTGANTGLGYETVL